MLAVDGPDKNAGALSKEVIDVNFLDLSNSTTRLFVKTGHRFNGSSLISNLETLSNYMQYEQDELELPIGISPMTK